LPDTFGITINQQTDPSMVDDQIGGIAFHSMAGANLDASFVGGSDDRKNEKQNAIFVGLGICLETDVI